jgi:hypothetical protein
MIVSEDLSSGMGTLIAITVGSLERLLTAYYEPVQVVLSLEADIFRASVEFPKQSIPAPRSRLLGLPKYTLSRIARMLSLIAHRYYHGVLRGMHKQDAVLGPFNALPTTRSVRSGTELCLAWCMRACGSRIYVFQSYRRLHRLSGTAGAHAATSGERSCCRHFRSRVQVGEVPCQTIVTCALLVKRVAWKPIGHCKCCCSELLCFHSFGSWHRYCVSITLLA